MRSVLFSSLLTGLFFFSSSAVSSSLDPDCSIIKASGNAEYPPYLWRDAEDPSELTGAIRFLIDDVSSALGIPIDLKYHGPWGRVQAKTARGNIDMISGAFFTKPRAMYMDYIYPQFQGTKTAVWVNTQNPFSFDIWKDLEPYKGITVVNNSFGQEFDEFSKKYLNIEEVGSLNQGLGMLSLGRVDYLIYEEHPALSYIKKYNIKGIETLPSEITQQALYLTLSKKSSCNTPELKEALHSLLLRFNKEHRMDNYLSRALTLWKQQADTVKQAD